MTAADFRRIALGFDGAEEGSHMGATDFRVGSRRAAHGMETPRGQERRIEDDETRATRAQVSPADNGTRGLR